MDEAYNEALPSKQKLQEEVDNYRKGYGGVMTERVRIMRQFNFLPVYFPGAFDVWALMLIGMALFKLGILQGERPAGFYARMAAIGYAVGIAVNSLSTYGMIAYSFDLVASHVLQHAVSDQQRGGRAGARLGADPARQRREDAMADRSAGGGGGWGGLNYISHSIIYALVF